MGTYLSKFPHILCKALSTWTATPGISCLSWLPPDIGSFDPLYPKFRSTLFVHSISLSLSRFFFPFSPFSLSHFFRIFYFLLSLWRRGWTARINLHLLASRASLVSRLPFFISRAIQFFVIVDKVTAGGVAVDGGRKKKKKGKKASSQCFDNVRAELGLPTVNRITRICRNSASLHTPAKSTYHAGRFIPSWSKMKISSSRCTRGKKVTFHSDERSN